MNAFYGGKTVLVTGSSGFLGSHLVERLVGLSAHVVGFDSEPPPASLTSRVRKGASVRFVPGDIADRHALDQAVRQDPPDVIFHLAAIASPRACARDFPTAFRVNVQGTANVLDVSDSVPHVVLLSSSAVYGAPEFEPMDETHPRGGRDPYATTKIMAELLGETYGKQYGRSCSIVRNFNAFGPRQAGEYVIPSIIQQALTNGRIEIWNSAPVRDFMFVDNTEDAILTVGAQSRPGTFNVGSGRGIRIGDLAEQIAGKVGRNVPVSDLRKEVIGSPALVADVTRLRNLGWQEKVSFDEGLARTVDWYRR